MSHTPGPWRVGEMCGGAINIEADMTPRHITVGRIYVCNTQSEAEATARLIAAAPDLLAALKEQIEIPAASISYVSFDEAKDRARAAIAKAEGR